MTKTERIIEYMYGMSDTDLAYTMANVCYYHHFYDDYWLEMGDFDDAMEDVMPSEAIHLATRAGDDFNLADEFFITDKCTYLYSANAEYVGGWMRDYIPEYARMLVAYGVLNTLDSGLNSILERGED